MKILKHGDLQPRKFTCTKCGCEFVADMTEYNKTTYTYCIGNYEEFEIYCPICEHRIIRRGNDAPLYNEETCDSSIDGMSDYEVREYCKLLHKKLLELQGEHDIYV